MICLDTNASKYNLIGRVSIFPSNLNLLLFSEIVKHFPVQLRIFIKVYDMRNRVFDLII
jgi:hypothetical protein